MKLLNSLGALAVCLQQRRAADVIPRLRGQPPGHASPMCLLAPPGRDELRSQMNWLETPPIDGTVAVFPRIRRPVAAAWVDLLFGRVSALLLRALGSIEVPCSPLRPRRGATLPGAAPRRRPATPPAAVVAASFAVLLLCPRRRGPGLRRRAVLPGLAWGRGGVDAAAAAAAAAAVGA